MVNEIPSAPSFDLTRTKYSRPLRKSSTDSITTIGIDDYLDRVILTVPGIPSNVTLESECDAVLVSVKSAINIGIVVVELITNSVKHAFPDNVPEKLILAKMKKLINRGVVDGCCCGCRGDFTITDKGISEMNRRRDECF